MYEVVLSCKDVEAPRGAFECKNESLAPPVWSGIELQGEFSQLLIMFYSPSGRAARSYGCAYEELGIIGF